MHNHKRTGACECAVVQPLIIPTMPKVEEKEEHSDDDAPHTPTGWYIHMIHSYLFIISMISLVAIMELELSFSYESIRQQVRTNLHTSW
jgi:hypothetical protein